MPSIGHLNLLDWVLIVDLCLVIPATQFRRSLRRKKAGRTVQSVLTRARRTLLMLGTPLVLLAGNWWIHGRPLSEIGLALPLSARGEIGIAIAIVLCLGFLMTSRTPADLEKRKAARAKFEDAGLLVATPADLAVFIPLAFLIGCGTEILFRGFLFWAFSPLVGLSGAVLVMALAYGLGHGFADWQTAAGSLVSAFLFAIAFALTQSLWWLMLIHTFMALFGAWNGYRLSRAVADTK
jgi:membrane protease YdiL (CAAX protease family)